MVTTQLAPPYPIFTDKSGDPLDAGFIYFGEPNLNPETNPITVYYDRGFTQPVAQPIRTSNGYVMRNGSPALIYADSQFSVTVRNKRNELVIYSPVGFGVVPGIPFATFENSAKDVAALLANTQFTYSAGVPNTVQVAAGDILLTLAEGFSYDVAASGATDQHVTTAGGVKLYVLPDAGGYNVKAFGAIGDNTADDTAAVQTAMNAGMANGTRVQFPAGDYRIFDTISLLNANFVKSFGFYGENANSTRIYFNNATSLKNLFFVDTNVNYLEVSDLEFIDVTTRTSRGFYFRDITPDPSGAAPAWKHLFRNVRIVAFKEGVRFDGGATISEDAHCSEVMFLHSKTRNCETGLVYNNIQAVNHQLIGFDMENDAEGVSDEWTHIKMERGTTINHIGGSVIGKGSYLSYTYAIAGGFQSTSQFSSKGVRTEKRGGTSPIIDHNTASTIVLSNSMRVIIDDMPVISSGGATLFARFGGRSFAKFSNIHANAAMDVEAYTTTNLTGNAEFGSIIIDNCKAINYKRISTVAAYGSAGIASTNYRSIPAEINYRNEGTSGQNDGSGYYTLSTPYQTVYQGGWVSAHIKTLVFSPSDSGGFGSGLNPATSLINLPLYGRPCKFRLLRDDINAGSAFQLDLVVVVGGVDYTVASITPTSTVGGHFEADIQTATGLTTFFNDGINWDGKMKVVKSGTVNGYVGLMMIDYM